MATNIVRRTGYYIQSLSYNPYYNLALEDYLVKWCEEQQIPVLYLWQNDNTVVIGRNQNAYTECNIDFINSNNIKVARRITGGGAVYHDLGNINYSIILPKVLYNKELSTSLIVSALENIGINAMAVGRNDIRTRSGKISGNAYYSSERASLHHGTILYRVDKDMLGKVLSVSKMKLSKNGVVSVKSRVSDIVSEYPNVRIEDVFESIRETFDGKYGAKPFEVQSIDDASLGILEEKYSSKQWIFDRINDYEISDVAVIDGEAVRVSLNFQGERLMAIEISTDSLYVEEVERFKNKCNAFLQENNVTDEKALISFFDNENESRLYKIIIDTVIRLLLRDNYL